MNAEKIVDQLFAGRETTIAKDLKLNLSRLLTQSSLSDQERGMLLASLGQTTKLDALTGFAGEWLQTLDMTAEQIQEAKESAAIMGMLNVYYRSQHFIHNDQEYAQAGLRMTSLGKPLIGKANFELLAFAVSCVNGCEKCVSSHEQALRKEGVTVDKIHDTMRLAAVIKGISSLL